MGRHLNQIRILSSRTLTGSGPFVYGRRRSVPSATQRSAFVNVAQEDWQVLIRDAHVGYISWAQFEHNQLTLKRNATGFGNGQRGSVPREGVGLLQGRVICGLCGARMRVRYQQVGGQQEPYYQCAEASVRQAGKLCQSIRGRSIDEAISALLLETVAPTALEAALAVQDEISARIQQSEALRQTRLEGARYEAELARRRFFNVDPDNRLVADALEAEWNERLRLLDALQQELEQQRQADQVLLSDEARQRVLALAHDFPRVWHDPRTAPLERKRMIATLIEDVTLSKGSEITVQVRFRGGKNCSFTLSRPLPMSRIRKTLPAVVEALDHLLDTCTDRQAAVRLNELGHRNWKGEPFTEKKVSLVRRTYGLNSRLKRLRARGFLTGSQLAKRLGVSTTTIHNWGRAGLLRRELYGNATRCLYAPLEATLPVKGRGGRRPTPPTLTTVSSSS